MKRADLVIYNAGQLVTCASAGEPKRRTEMADVTIVANGAVAIADSHFIGVGTTEQIVGEFQASSLIDANFKVVCPGFVDPHSHIVFAGDRLDEFELKIKGADYLEILAGGGGIISTVRQTREASIDDLVERSTARLDKMLECGTTTCEIKTGYGLDTETELKMLAVIEILDQTHPIDVVPTFLAAHAIPPEFKGDPEGYVDLICSEMLPLAWQWYQRSHFASAGIPFFADVFTEKNSFDINQSRRVLETARDLGFGIKAHVDEFTNLGGSRLAIELGATSIDHLDAISDEETELLADSKTVGVITPTVNFNFGSPHFADPRRLIDAGCLTALSTDFNPGSAPCPSLPMAMAIACRYQKLLPSEAMNAATVNAAWSIGMGIKLGSIEVGKRADLVFLNAFDYRELANEFGGNLVSSVMKAGRFVYGDR